MKEQSRIFFTALMFYTRIPCPANIDHSPAYINKAARFFPLIGWIVGLISFGAYWLGATLFGDAVGIVFSLIAGVLTTGAFHEDGLADVFDGFGGGWTKEKILEIMKDSRVGAYGVIALIMLFLLKYLALDELLSATPALPLPLIATLFVAYHALARLTAVNLVFFSSYAREDASSKAKPIAQTHSKTEIFGAYLGGLLPLLALMYWHWQAVFLLLPLFGVGAYAKGYFEKWLGGYTGDCLGAVEQIAECVLLLTYLALWNSISYDIPV